MLKINAFAGHFRIRMPMLRQVHVLEEVTSIMRMIPGVISIEAKVRTGSLLIKYDPRMLPAHLQPTIEAMLPELKELYKKHSGQQSHENYGPYAGQIKAVLEQNLAN